MLIVFFVNRVSELLDYTAEELTGKNLYTLCHGEDANKLRKCHLDRKYYKIAIFKTAMMKKPHGIINRIFSNSSFVLLQ